MLSTHYKHFLVILSGQGVRFKMYAKKLYLLRSFLFKLWLYKHEALLNLQSNTKAFGEWKTVSKNKKVKFIENKITLSACHPVLIQLSWIGYLHSCFHQRRHASLQFDSLINQMWSMPTFPLSRKWSIQSFVTTIITHTPLTGMKVVWRERGEYTEQQLTQFTLINPSLATNKLFQNF